MIQPVTKAKPHHSSGVPRWPKGTGVNEGSGAGGGRFMSRNTIFRGSTEAKESSGEAEDIGAEVSSPSQETGLEYAENIRLAIIEQADFFEAEVAKAQSQYEAALAGRDEILRSHGHSWDEIELDPEAKAEWLRLQKQAGDAMDEIAHVRWELGNAVVEVLKAPTPALIPVVYDDAIWNEDSQSWTMQQYVDQESFKGVWHDLTSIIDESIVTSDETVKIQAKEGHGGVYNPNESILHVGVEAGDVTFWHEMGHWLEDKNPEHWRQVSTFLDNRHPEAKPEYWNAERIPYDPGGYVPGTYEGFRDEYIDPYMGRIYMNPQRGPASTVADSYTQRSASEITSMGLDFLRRDPGALAKGDPDYFNHLVMWLHGKYETTVKAIQRDISHVMRDEKGRWMDTPGVGADAPKQNDTERQQALDSQIKPDIESATFEGLIRQGLKEHHNDLGDPELSNFFMEQWRKADRDQKERLYERFFAEHMGPLHAPKLDRVIEEIGPERHESEFIRHFEPSFEPVREMAGPQGISPWDFYKEMPGGAPFDNKQALDEALYMYWGLNTKWGDETEDASPLAWRGIANRLNRTRDPDQRDLGRPQAGDEFWFTFDKEGNREIFGVLTEAQADWLYTVPNEAYEARLDKIRQGMGLTTNMNHPESMLSEFGLSNIIDPFELGRENRQAYNDLKSQAQNKGAELLDRIDISRYSASEIDDALGGYIQERAAQLGVRSLMSAPEGTDDYNLGLMWNDFVSRPLGNEYAFRVRSAIATGQIDPELGLQLAGYSAKPQGVGGWQELPEELYHTTTSVDAVIGDRLRSRKELGQLQGGKGLGGGENDTISFTTDQEIGKQIERSLHEAWYIGNGMLTSSDMMRIAQRGGGSANRPYLKDVIAGFTTREKADRLPDDLDIDNPDHRALLPEVIQQVLRVDEGAEQPPEPSRDWHPPTEEWARQTAWDIYKNYAAYREFAGGHFNPLFFSSDWKGLSEMNPEQFQTLTLTPRPGAKGYLMSSMAEWRTVGGNTVAVTEATNHYDYKSRQDYEEIVGWNE